MPGDLIKCSKVFIDDKGRRVKVRSNEDGSKWRAYVETSPNVWEAVADLGWQKSLIDARIGLWVYAMAMEWKEVKV